MKLLRRLAALAALTIGGLGLTYTEAPASALPCSGCSIYVPIKYRACGLYADFEIDTTMSTDELAVLNDFLLRTPGRTFVNSGGGLGGGPLVGLSAWNRARVHLLVTSAQPLDLRIGTVNAWGYDSSITRLSLDPTQPISMVRIPVTGETPGSVITAYVTLIPNQVSPSTYHC